MFEIPEDVLVAIITAERVAVAVSWSIICAIGFCALVRIATGVSILLAGPGAEIDEPIGRKGDIGWASMGLVGAGLLIFQWRTLGGYVVVTPDPFVAISLFSFLLSAAGIFYARGMRAAEGHQRAAILSHFFLLAILMFAGALSVS